MNAPTTNSGDRGLTCEDVMRHTLAEKYVSGDLSEQQATEFEQHYFGCGRCFEELQAYQTVQQGVLQAAPIIRAAEQHKPRRWSFAPRWAVVLAGAALVFAASLILVRSPGPRQTAETVVISPSSPTARAPSISPSPAPPSPALIAELARVSPPPYNAVVLRGSQEEATLRFQEAMRQYQRGNYAGAILGLRAARKLRPRAAEINFYLGVSYLLSKQYEKAIEQLRRTSQLPDRTYATQAHFYLAKVYLKQGDIASGSSELKQVISSGGEQAHEAQRILLQLGNREADRSAK